MYRQSFAEDLKIRITSYRQGYLIPHIGSTLPETPPSD